MTYKIGDIVTQNYTVTPMPVVLRHRIGGRIPINENGQMVAMGEVIETTADNYKLRIIVTYRHNRRGPSEFK